MLAEIPLWLLIIDIVAGTLLFFIIAAVIVIVLVRREINRWHAQGLVFVKGPETANYRGHASINIPMKGTGVLAMTDTDLRFARAFPRKEFVIPLAQITQLERRSSWKNSYRAGSPVLVVHYRSGAHEDAIGFHVRDIASWEAAIAGAANLPPTAE